MIEESMVKSGNAGPLSGVRVLELDGGLGQYCGKVLADLGAEVIRVEPTEGSAARKIPPFADDIPGAERSLHFWHYNTNKRSVVLNLESESDRTALLRLAGSVDIVIDGREIVDSSDPAMIINAESLTEQSSRLIYTRITPFGTTGPWADYASSDLVQLALGGTMAMTGYDDFEGSKSFPIAPAGGQAANFAGIMAAIATLGALNARDHTDRGQVVDVAAHDVVAISNEMAFPYWEYEHKNVHRHTARHGNSNERTPRQMFRCRDGKYAMCLTLYLRETTRWNALVNWMDSLGLAEDLLDDAYASPAYRTENQYHLIDVIERFCAQLDSDVLFHEAQLRRIPWGPVNQVWDLLNDAHLKDDRGSIVDIKQPELNRTISYPGAPYQFKRTPWSLRHTAPSIGADTSEVMNNVH